MCIYGIISCKAGIAQSSPIKLLPLVDSSQKDITQKLLWTSFLCEQMQRQRDLLPLTAVGSGTDDNISQNGLYSHLTAFHSVAPKDVQGFRPSTTMSATAEARPPGRKRSKVAQACQRCRKSKARCSGAAPCARCTQMEQICHYDPEQPRRKNSDTVEGVGPFWKLPDTICDSCSTIEGCDDYKPCTHCLKENHDCRVHGVFVKEVAKAKIRQIEMSETASRQASGSYLGSEIHSEQGHRSDQGSGRRPALPRLKPNTIGTLLSTSQSRAFPQQNPLGGFGGTMTD